MFAGATRLQVRRAPAARRVLAFVAGMWLVAFGMLGARHEANIAHYTDARTGEVFHASGGACKAHSNRTHVHDATRSAQHDHCALASVLHQAVSPDVAAPACELAPAVALADTVPSVRLAFASALYRLAPKTSPPAHA